MNSQLAVLPPIVVYTKKFRGLKIISGTFKVHKKVKHNHVCPLRFITYCIACGLLCIDCLISLSICKDYVMLVM